VFGPRGMPETLRKSIAADFRAVSTDPAIAERLASFGTIMDIRGPAEFAASVQEQREKLAALAKTLGIKAAQ
jgi:tripartite-type tricarboxylate transporter receptor subunit TctC